MNIDMSLDCGTRVYCSGSLFECWVTFGVAYIQEHNDIPCAQMLYEHVEGRDYKPSTLYQISLQVDKFLRSYLQAWRLWQHVRFHFPKPWKLTVQYSVIRTGHAEIIWRAVWKGETPSPISNQFLVHVSYQDLLETMMRPEFRSSPNT